jgi:hypothetical protein
VFPLVMFTGDKRKMGSTRRAEMDAGRLAVGATVRVQPCTRNL